MSSIPLVPSSAEPPATSHPASRLHPDILREVEEMYADVKPAAFKKALPGMKKAAAKMLDHARTFSSFSFEERPACKAFGLNYTKGTLRSIGIFDRKDRERVKYIQTSHRLVRSVVNMSFEVALRIMVDPVMLCASEAAGVALFPEHPLEDSFVHVNGVRVEVSGEADYVASLSAENDTARELRQKLASGRAAPRFPFCVVVEVKRSREFKSAFGQLIAELQACLALIPKGVSQCINGILTDGIVYVFVRLEGTNLLVSVDVNSVELVYGLVKICMTGESPFTAPSADVNYVTSKLSPGGTHRITEMVTPITPEKSAFSPEPSSEDEDLDTPPFLAPAAPAPKEKPVAPPVPAPKKRVVPASKEKRVAPPVPAPKKSVAPPAQALKKRVAPPAPAPKEKRVAPPAPAPKEKRVVPPAPAPKPFVPPAPAAKPKPVAPPATSSPIRRKRQAILGNSPSTTKTHRVDHDEEYEDVDEEYEEDDEEDVEIPALAPTRERGAFDDSGDDTLSDPCSPSRSRVRAPLRKTKNRLVFSSTSSSIDFD